MRSITSRIHAETTGFTTSRLEQIRLTQLQERLMKKTKDYEHSLAFGFTSFKVDWMRSMQRLPLNRPCAVCGISTGCEAAMPPCMAREFYNCEYCPFRRN